MPPKRETQQPLVHRLPPQHWEPVLPHFAQRELEQAVLASVQTLPAQQGPPVLPHRAQMPLNEE